MRKIDLVLNEVREIRADVRALNGRIDRIDNRMDGVNARLDTVIDALADLRRDFDQHTHEN